MSRFPGALDLIAHRGLDGQGLFEDEHISLIFGLRV